MFLPEALCADKTAGVKELSVGVDNFGLGFESVLAACTGHAVHVHHAGHVPSWEGGWDSLLFYPLPTLRLAV